MGFSTFTILCNRPLSLVPEYFHHPEGEFPIDETGALPSPSLATANLCSVSVGLPILHISYKWNHTGAYSHWSAWLCILGLWVRAPYRVQRLLKNKILKNSKRHYTMGCLCDFLSLLISFFVAHISLFPAFHTIHLPLPWIVQVREVQNRITGPTDRKFISYYEQSGGGAVFKCFLRLGARANHLFLKWLQLLYPVLSLQQISSLKFLAALKGDSF